VSSLFAFTITPTTVHAAIKPSVPQFSLKLVDDSYDVPPSTTTAVNEYTGEKITYNWPGYRVNIVTIEVKIKLQPFTPYGDENGNQCVLYYNVQYKGHFGGEQDWKNVYNNMAISGLSSELGNMVTVDSQYITIPITYDSRSSKDISMFLGTQVDFRVKTEIRHTILSYDPPIYEIIVDASSGWSNIQTITIPNHLSSSPSQTVTSTEDPTTSDGNQITLTNFTLPANFMIGVIVILLGVIVALVILVFRRQPKTPTCTNNSPQNNALLSCHQNFSFH
jgi:hypothetical protein